MDGWRYHTRHFTSDVRTFFASLERGPRTTNIGDGVVRSQATSFHIEDLGPSPDHLSHVPPENLAAFAAALAYVVLINQVMHSHFRAEHGTFQQRARYPLVAGGLNPTRSPYAVLDAEAWEARGVTRADREAAWQALVAHLRADVCDYLEGPGRDHGIDWHRFRDAMRGDRDIVAVAPWGVAVARVLEAGV